MNVAEERKKTLRKLDKAILAANKAGKNRQQTADELGVHVRTVIRRAKKMGLTR